MGSSCECGSTSSRWPSSECRDVAAVPGDAHQQVCVAPSSCLGGYRDSGDDEAPFEAADRQTSAFAGTAGLFEFEQIKSRLTFHRESLHPNFNYLFQNIFYSINLTTHIFNHSVIDLTETWLKNKNKNLIFNNIFRTYLQLGEDLCEESRLAVDSQHLGAKSVDNQEASVPEFILAVLDEERLKRVTDLIAHVTVAQVKTCQYRRLKLFLGRLISIHEFFHQHIHKYYIGRVYKGHVLSNRKREDRLKSLIN